MHATARSVVFVVCLALLLVMAARFYDHTVDDAFISFRYADNLAHGEGLVFNPGERVEGYTNFLWVLLIAPFLALSLDPETVARLLGIGASVGLLALVVRHSPRDEAMPALVWLAPLLVASSPPLAVWATGGLETPLYCGLVMAAIALALKCVERRSFDSSWSWPAAAAALTRPDGLGLALALLLLLALLLRKRPGYLGGLLRSAGVLCGVVLPYFLWRWIYYGDLLPNTFYAKVGAEPEQLGRGLRYVDGFFDASGYWLLLPLVGLVWIRADRRAMVLAGAALVLLGFPLLVGGDALPMFRFIAPALAPAYLLLAVCATVAARRFAPGKGAKVVLGLLALALVGRTTLPAFRGEPVRLVENDRREVAAWKEVGRYFGSLAKPGDSIAVITAGAIPYFSKLPAIDMLGLTDRTIARSEVSGLGRGWAGHEKHDVDYLLGRRPTFVVVGTYGLAPRELPAQEMVRPFYAAEKQLLRSTRFLDEYRLARARTDSGYFAFFVRADLVP